MATLLDTIESTLEKRTSIACIQAALPVSHVKTTWCSIIAPTCPRNQEDTLTITIINNTLFINRPIKYSSSNSHYLLLLLHWWMIFPNAKCYPSCIAINTSDPIVTNTAYDPYIKRAFHHRPVSLRNVINPTAYPPPQARSPHGHHNHAGFTNSPTYPPPSPPPPSHSYVNHLHHHLWTINIVIKSTLPGWTMTHTPLIPHHRPLQPLPMKTTRISSSSPIS